MARLIGNVSLYKTVAVTVAEGQTAGSSAADAELVGNAFLLGVVPVSTDADVVVQAVEHAVLNADGSVTITVGEAVADGDLLFTANVVRAQF